MLQVFCSRAVIATWSHPSHVQEMKVTAEVLPSSPKLLPGEVGGWAAGSCTNLLPYRQSVLPLFIQGSGTACWGEKERPSAANSYSVPRLQLCKLWAYLIHQLGKVRIKWKLQSSGWAGELMQLLKWQPQLCSRARYRKKYFCFIEDWSGFPHSPETQPLPEPLTLMLGLELGCPALCLMAESPSMEMEGR